MADSKDFFIGVLVGSAIGAAAALLYAPQAGTDTRLLLKEKAGEAKERGTELAQQAKGKATDLVHTAQARVTDATSTARTKVSDLAHQAQDLADRGRLVVERQKEAITTAVEAGRQAYTEKQSALQAEVQTDIQPADGGSPAPAV